MRLLLEAGAPSCLLYLRVADVRTAVESLRNRGVEILTEPHEIFVDSEGLFGERGHAEWMAFIRDSEGNTVGLDSRPRWRTGNASDKVPLLASRSAHDERSADVVTDVAHDRAGHRADPRPEPF